MTDQLREQAQYRKGKTPIIAKYLDEHSKMMAEIAGRGFLQLPGYAYDAENNIELAAKMGLSDLNYKILTETIERELKQSGLDYDLAYKNDLILWQIEKQALMDAWEAEYSTIKQSMAGDEEALTRLAIEVGQRAIYLLDQKTAIESEMEGYRTQLATLDGTIAPYEVQLANAKLLTAQKKLEIIPVLNEIIVKEYELLSLEQTKAAEYTTLMSAESLVVAKELEVLPIINEILGKEQDLLTIEQDKSSAYTDLMSAEMEVATKKELMIAPLSELVNVTERYILKLQTQMEYEGQIADEKLAQAQSFVRKVQTRLLQLTQEVENSGKELTLIGSKREVQTTHSENELVLQANEISKEQTYQADLLINSNDIITDENAGRAYIIEQKKLTDEKKLETRLLHSENIHDAEAGASSGVAAAEAAHIAADELLDEKQILAKLIHLIG